MNFLYSVSVIEIATGSAVKQSTVIGISKATRLARGLEINIGDGFRVEVVKL